MSTKHRSAHRSSSGIVRSLLAGIAGSAAMLALAAPATAVGRSEAAYLIRQRSKGGATRLILTPGGLRIDFYAQAQGGGSSKGRRHANRLQLQSGLIIHYRDARLLLLDPAQRTFQALPLKKAIAGYRAEAKMLAHARAAFSNPHGGDGGVPPVRLPSPPARLRRLRVDRRIGVVTAKAYLLRQGKLRERIWYSSQLPAPPARIERLLRRAIAGSSASPLARALRARAGQIPLRIDELSESKRHKRHRARRHGHAPRRWQTVLRTVSVRRRRVRTRTLRPPRRYRKAGGHHAGKSPHHAGRGARHAGRAKARSADVPATVVRVPAGPISHHPYVWAFYWGRGWSAHPDYVRAINRGLANMVGDASAGSGSSSFYGPLAQYGVHKGKLLGYSVIDSNPDPGVGASNFPAVWWLILSNRYGTPAPKNWSRIGSHGDPIFAVFVDRSKVDASGWGGYHAAVPTESALFPFAFHPAMPYFVIKAPALDGVPHEHESSAWQQSVDTATELASHELVEAATDPYPFFSWSDPLKEPVWEFGEISDICQEGETAPWGKDTRTALHGTAVEPYWSDQAKACVPDARPTAQIVLPHDGGTYSWGMPLPFEASTSDLLEDGPVSDGGITWSDDVAGAGFAHGRTFDTSSLSPGTHHISLTVEDSAGGVREVGPITIHVVADPPTVKIDHPADGASFGADQTITFRGEAIDPAQGDIGSSATWAVDGRPVGSGASVLRYDITAQGTHTVTLSATDGGGATSTASIHVHVGPPTGNPSVFITRPADKEEFAEGTPILFSATAKSTGSATITHYSWDDDLDGHLGDGASISRVLSGTRCAFATHHVTVAAEDNLGRTATDTVTLIVGGIC